MEDQEASTNQMMPSPTVKTLGCILLMNITDFLTSGDSSECDVVIFMAFFKNVYQLYALNCILLLKKNIPFISGISNLPLKRPNLEETANQNEQIFFLSGILTHRLWLCRNHLKLAQFSHKNPRLKKWSIWQSYCTSWAFHGGSPRRSS